jgi:hypothetical protein
VRFKIVVPLAEQKSLAAPHNTTNATETIVQITRVVVHGLQEDKSRIKGKHTKKRRQTNTNDVVKDV